MTKTKLPILQAYTVSLRGIDECDCTASCVARERAVIFQRENPLIHNTVELNDVLKKLIAEVKEISTEIGTMITHKPRGLTLSCHKGWRIVFVLDIDVKEK
jgi:hypothetical protein